MRLYNSYHADWMRCAHDKRLPCVAIKRVTTVENIVRQHFNEHNNEFSMFFVSLYFFRIVAASGIIFLFNFRIDLYTNRCLICKHGLLSDLVRLIIHSAGEFQIRSRDTHQPK